MKHLHWSGIGAALLLLGAAGCGGGEEGCPPGSVEMDGRCVAAADDGGRDGGTDEGGTDVDAAADGGAGTEGGMEAGLPDGGAIEGMPCSVDDDCPARAHTTGSCADTDEDGTPDTCRYVCEAGWSDCDEDETNGCEQDIATDPDHCGACGEACPGGDNATAVCTAGACGLSCDPGFGDCDGDATNGCEQDLTSDTAHCGACETSCDPVAGATVSCEMSACVYACAAPNEDCDGAAANGCEVNTNTDVANCGMCGNACPDRQHTSKSCMGGSCAYSCTGAWRACDGAADDGDGCEVNTNTDVANCGMCGNACPDRQHTSKSCSGGSCAYSCTGAWRACDGAADDMDGCEVDTNTDVNNCGACGNVCGDLPNTSKSCSDGSCAYSCTGAWRACDGAADDGDGCEVNTNTDVNNCGRCGNACADRPNMSRSCAAGTCQYSCVSGYADVNGDGTGSDADGCEVNLNTDPNHCGAEGNVCSLGCVSGTCRQVQSVDVGYEIVCALATDGTLWCWGKGQFGLLGNGTTPSSVTRPRRAAGSRLFSEARIGAEHICGKLQTADASGYRLYCWGRNDWGQAGQGDFDSPVTVPGPVQGIPSSQTVGDFFLGSHHGCVETSTPLGGSPPIILQWVRCWGNGGSGRLGNGSTSNQHTAVVAMNTGGTNVPDLVALGSNASFGTASGGTLVAWGYGAYGQLGTGNTSSQTRAVPASRIGSYAELNGYGDFACRRTTSGTVYCWGYNGYGEGRLGRNNASLQYDVDDGTCVRRSTSTCLYASSLARGSSATHACAVATSGSVYCWGNGTYGKLGRGSTSHQTYARPVTLPTGTLPSGESVQGVVVGSKNTCVWSETRVWCWGDNTRGQVGVGVASGTRTTPELVCMSAPAGSSIPAICGD